MCFFAAEKLLKSTNRTTANQSAAKLHRFTPDLKPALYRFGQESSKEGSRLHNPYYNSRIESLTQGYSDTTAQEKVQAKKARRFPPCGAGGMLQQPGRLLIYFSEKINTPASSRVATVPL